MPQMLQFPFVCFTISDIWFCFISHVFLRGAWFVGVALSEHLLLGKWTLDIFAVWLSSQVILLFLSQVTVQVSWPHPLHSTHGDCCITKWATTWQNQQNDRAPSEDSDQPGHSPSLIRVFAVHMKRACVLSYPLSAQRRLWSDWADAQADLSLRWAYSWAYSHFVGFVMRRLKWSKQASTIRLCSTYLEQGDGARVRLLVQPIRIFPIVVQ